MIPAPELAFRDGGSQQTGVPKWATYLLRVGWHFAASRTEPRRIALITMPCPSPAVGLVAVGAVCRRLTLASASDIAGHSAALIARYRAERQHTIYRHIANTKDFRGRFVISRVNEEREVVEFIRENGSAGDLTHIYPVRNLKDWFVDGDPPLEVRTAEEGVSHARLYQQLLGTSARIHEENLRLTESAVVLATTIHGASVTRELLEDTSLQSSDDVASLAELTTIKHWTPVRVSRVVHYNPLSDRLDRPTVNIRLVVLDGFAALRRVVHDERFADADVVAILDPYVTPTGQDDIDAWLDGVRQWYQPLSPDAQSELANGESPIGISAVCLCKRSP